MNYKALATEMRENGVAKLRFDPDTKALVEIELAPYMYDPTAAAPEGPEPEKKSAGQCEYPGCEKPNGWAIVPAYCREHGLISMGVKGVEHE